MCNITSPLLPQSGTRSFSHFTTVTKSNGCSTGFILDSDMTVGIDQPISFVRTNKISFTFHSKTTGEVQHVIDIYLGDKGPRNGWTTINMCVFVKVEISATNPSVLGGFMTS